MAITLKGLVYYADDPDKKVFRIIYLQPNEDDTFFDTPPCYEFLELLNLGCDQNRNAVYQTVSLDTPDNFTGTPFAPPTSNGTDANGNPWPPVQVDSDDSE